MCQVRRIRWLMALGGCFALVPFGCRDSEPPRSLYEDLGTNGRALLPTSSAWHDTAIADGSADWHPFREPSKEPPAEPVAGGGSNATGVAADIDAEIRELIGDHNALLGDATVDEILEYYVESQHDAIRPVLEAGEKVAQSLTAIREKLEAALPDAGERVDAAMKSLEAQIPGTLAIGELIAEGEAVVVAKLLRNPDIPTCRVRLIDDEWFLEIPDVDGLAAAKSAADATAARLAAMVKGLDAGTTSAEVVLEQVEAAASDGGAARDTTDDDAEPTDEDSADESDGG